LVDGEQIRRALSDSDALVAFTRSPMIGPDVGTAKAFKDVIPWLDERAMALLDAWSEMGSRVYQALFRARVTEGGVLMAADFTTCAADPRDARAAYEAALGRRAEGDDAGYRAALADVERRFPGSLAAKRAAEVRGGVPYLGAGTIFMVMMSGLARRSQE